MSRLLHPNEGERINSLRTAMVLDTARDDRFDRVVFTAAQVHRVPIALITFVDSDRTWVKSHVGLQLGNMDRDTLCGWTILQPDMLIVPDALEHEEFRSNRYVTGPPFVRFYAGVPIRSRQGLPIGALCVLDRVPRPAHGLRLANLVMLARMVEQLVLDL